MNASVYSPAAANKRIPSSTMEMWPSSTGPTVTTTGNTSPAAISVKPAEIALASREQSWRRAGSFGNASTESGLFADGPLK
jgi:hypothetical protein